MKIIDLLNKIANGENIPEKIKLKNTEPCFHYQEESGKYIFAYIDTNGKKGIAELSILNLNDEIEIIEEDIEEDKPIEKIRQFCEYPCSDKYECWSIKEDILVNKINEIIDVVNELKEKQNKNY